MAIFLEMQLYLAWHVMAYAGYGTNVMTFLSMGVHYLLATQAFPADKKSNRCLIELTWNLVFC
jgi:hypothetical protein